MTPEERELLILTKEDLIDGCEHFNIHDVSYPYLREKDKTANYDAVIYQDGKNVKILKNRIGGVHDMSVLKKFFDKIDIPKEFDLEDVTKSELAAYFGLNSIDHHYEYCEHYWILHPSGDCISFFVEEDCDPDDAYGSDINSRSGIHKGKDYTMILVDDGCGHGEFYQIFKNDNQRFFEDD